MPAKRVYTSESIAIMQRFFEAVDYLIDKRKIIGIQSYCNLAGIERRAFYQQRDNIDAGHFQISWVLPLINYFHLRPDWLLNGEGKMFDVEIVPSFRVPQTRKRKKKVEDNPEPVD